MNYKHTQIGWLIIGAEALALAILTPMLMRAGATAWALLAAALLVGAALLFGTLTVELGPDALHVRLGPGLVRARLPLAQVRSFRKVRDPWYFGWGVRLIPRAVLYRVSGLDAVEVVLDNGKCYHIGTDEPDALVDALRLRLGEPRPLSPEESAALKPPATIFWVAVAIVLVIVLAVAGLLFMETRPPQAQIVDNVLQIHSFVYRVEVPCADITELELISELPRVLRRTNGSALGQSLRGHFTLAELGPAMLFVEKGRPPYIFVRTGDQLVFVNLPRSAETEALYGELLQCLTP